MKYDKKKAEQIVSLFASGDYKIADICKQVGIAESTYYKWKTDKSEFSESIKNAQDARLEAFKGMARSGLAKLLDVYTVEESVVEYVDNGQGKPKIKGRKVTQRVFMPNAAAIIFTLKNTDPDNWKDKQEIEHSDAPITWEETRTYEADEKAD
ncbi:phBC6A51 family helix-turn-helix protein [Hymenobacter fodinae]|uniref:Uncharacterized protein n=1 Tax=Hymenobacter fodinae TaxID=2510796 RepID=A0A4Z0P8J2_9BACT|nr:phBC6A51 family helix-turn-helix protein [Hymenobacter fodinae]TGE08268.1 hypothetical protein EU556_11135 [Hymenobacter fodinae]